MLPEEPTALSNLVRVHPHFARSVNLPRDASSAAVLEGYVLSPHALHSLERLVAGVRSAQNAWTITGPYGSGKSLFALFLTALLSRTHPLHALAMRKLESAAPTIADSMAHLPSFAPVLAVGRRAEPARCILDALARLPALPTRVADELARLLHAGAQMEERALDEALFWALEHIAQRRDTPLLVVLDEMGKTLEYAARRPQADLYLFQRLAELPPERILFVGILHQAFENYIQQLDAVVRREWEKVQGRFADLPFVESTEQMMRLVALAFQPRPDGAALGRCQDLCRQLAEDAVRNGLALPTMRPAEFVEIAGRAYPLHPLTLVVLPHLFRRHAQNERSLFAFLAAHEPHGLQEFLASHTVAHTPCNSYMPLFMLCHLFDYLTSGFGHSLYTSVHARPIAQALQTLRQRSWTDREVLTIKTVAMLQWASDVSHLRPNPPALECAVSPTLDGSQLRDALCTLRERSVIAFRGFDQTYRIWQGSDIDVEERLQQARRRLGPHLHLAQLVGELVPPAAITAREHTYRTGTLRAFVVRYADLASIEHADTLAPPPEGYAGTILVCLPETEAQAERMAAWAQSPEPASREQLVIAVPKDAMRLHEVLRELVSMRWVQQNTPQLRDDPVARRELRERMDAVQQAALQQVQGMLSACRWFHGGQERPVRGRRGLNAFLSAVCNQVYHSAPLIRNELINRWALSSAASAGRRNLVEAMLTRPHLERLGIDGYPPERGMYESLLRATGLHTTSGVGWGFQEPPEDDPTRLRPLWRCMQEAIFAVPPRRINVAELQQQLAMPPYGLTPPMFPVLLCAFLQAHSDETTLYREGTLLPEPTVADWEVLLRRPELFAVAGCRTDGARASLLRRIAERWSTQPKTVPIVRELVRRLRALPDHAWRTRRLPREALALREVVARAQSPERLVFHDIPSALGVPLRSDDDVDALIEAMRAALNALADVTPKTIEWARDELLAACGLPGGDSGWRAFRRQAAALQGRVSHPQLRPLLARAAGGASSEPSADDEQAVLESVLAYVAGRPPRTWTDADVEGFPQLAGVLGEAYRRVCLLGLHEICLTPEEEQRRDGLLVQLREALGRDPSQRVRLSALRRLLEDETA